MARSRAPPRRLRPRTRSTSPRIFMVRYLVSMAPPTPAFPWSRSKRCAPRSKPPACRLRPSRRSSPIPTRRTPSTPTIVRATARSRRKTAGSALSPGSRPTASADRPLVESTGIKTRSGLTFTAGGPLVLLLHGFPESRHSWRAALPALAAAGYRAVAPDQRGYSPGARPDPSDLSNYAFDRLVADVIEIAAAAGYDGTRFHLVGHDWGGQVSWGVAGKHPERLASLTILSRPHPSSFRRALLKEA